MRQNKQKWPFFWFSIECFLCKWLCYLNRLSKKCQVGPKLKRIKTGIEREKKEAVYNEKWHHECKKMAPFTKFGSRIDFQLKKLTQDIHNTHEFKCSQKLLQNTFHLRPIWDQRLKPFRNESNLKKDRSSGKFC